MILLFRRESLDCLFYILDLGRDEMEEVGVFLWFFVSRIEKIALKESLVHLIRNIQYSG